MESRAPQADDYREALRRRRVLIVGGGAIGQVYGYHLAQGGAEVSYLLKPRYAAEAAEGFDLHRYGVMGLRPKRHLKAEVYTDQRLLRSQKFDQVWLCISSTALRADGFVEGLAKYCPDAVWVSFQPGVEDHNYITWRCPDLKVVHGLVNFVAYQSPLPGEDLWPEGIAYFVPPMSMTQFTGPEPYVSTIANMLQAGGLTAGVRPDTIANSRFGSAVLIPFVVALECSNWSFANLRRNSALLELVTTSVDDLHAAIERQTGRYPGPLSWFQKKWVWKAALAVLPTLASFPAEAFFQHHFTKVRDQTDQMVVNMAQLCRDNALIPRALESLGDQWRSRRADLKVDPDYRDPRTGRLQRIDTPAPGTVPEAAPAAPAAVPKLAAPIAIDDLDDEDVAPAAVLAPPAVSAIEMPDDDLGAFEIEGYNPAIGLEEVTGEGDPEVAAQDANLLEVELEPMPPVEPEGPKPDAPILRTLADLDKIPAIVAPEPESEPEPEPSLGLPFDVEDDVISSAPAMSIAAPEHPRVSPEAAIEQKRDMQPTVREPTLKEVHFQNAVPEEKRADLSREDFIQTEFATEDQNASLRDLKSKLRARFGSPKPMSPALSDDDDGDEHR